MPPHSEIFTLENFEGPLDLLWHLINRQELDIYEISITQITQQYLKAVSLELDRGAEFISLASSLMWFKSKTLLPKHEQQKDENLEEELDPNFTIIHQLIDYCRFKQAAKKLSEREQQQAAFYPRGVEGGETKKNLGINHLSLDDLANLFEKILAKATPKTETIQEEMWKTSDKIHDLKKRLAEQKTLDFFTIFNSTMSKMELIVTFLALLELMKSGEVKVVQNIEQNTHYIIELVQNP